MISHINKTVSEIKLAFDNKRKIKFIQAFDGITGAATFHPDGTVLQCFSKAESVHFYQPCVRVSENSIISTEVFVQYQAVLPVTHTTALKTALDILESIGISKYSEKYTIDVIKSSWAQRSLDAKGDGYEIIVNNLEVAQITQFDTMCGSKLSKNVSEITFGVDRLAMLLNNVYDIKILTVSNEILPIKDELDAIIKKTRVTKNTAVKEAPRIIATGFTKLDTISKIKELNKISTVTDVLKLSSEKYRLLINSLDVVAASLRKSIVSAEGHVESKDFCITETGDYTSEKNLEINIPCVIPNLQLYPHVAEEYNCSYNKENHILSHRTNAPPSSNYIKLLLALISKSAASEGDLSWAIRYKIHSRTRQRFNATTAYIKSILTNGWKVGNNEYSPVIDTNFFIAITSILEHVPLKISNTIKIVNMVKQHAGKIINKHRLHITNNMIFAATTRIMVEVVEAFLSGVSEEYKSAISMLTTSLLDTSMPSIPIGLRVIEALHHVVPEHPLTNNQITTIQTDIKTSWKNLWINRVKSCDADHKTIKPILDEFSNHKSFMLLTGRIIELLNSGELQKLLIAKKRTLSKIKANRVELPKDVSHLHKIQIYTNLHTVKKFTSILSTYNETPPKEITHNHTEEVAVVLASIEQFLEDYNLKNVENEVRNYDTIKTSETDIKQTFLFSAL